MGNLPGQERERQASVPGGSRSDSRHYTKSCSPSTLGTCLPGYSNRGAPSLCRDVGQVQPRTLLPQTPHTSQSSPQGPNSPRSSTRQSSNGYRPKPSPIPSLSSGDLTLPIFEGGETEAMDHPHPHLLLPTLPTCMTPSSECEIHMSGMSRTQGSHVQGENARQL